MKTFLRVLKSCIPFLLAGALILFMVASIGNFSKGSRAEEKQHLEDALRRAALSCYASKGYYPPNLEYIEDKYGIQINRDDFAVFYEVFAENLMPDITVVVK